MDLTSLGVNQIYYFNLLKQDQDVHQSEYGGLCDYPPWDGPHPILHPVQGSAVCSADWSKSRYVFIVRDL